MWTSIAHMGLKCTPKQTESNSSLAAHISIISEDATLFSQAMAPYSAGLHSASINLILFQLTVGCLLNNINLGQLCFFFVMLA